jgi:predicted transcriptional regulator
MRTLIDLPDSQVQALATLCERAKLPRAAIIREAIAEYLGRHAPKPADTAFALWETEPLDGLAYQEKARAEW